MILSALHAALTAGIIVSAPRSLRSPRWTAGLVWIGTCVAAGLLAPRPGAALGCAAAILPFLVPGIFGSGRFLPLVLLLDGVLLALASSGVPAAALPAGLLAAAVASGFAFHERRPRRVIVAMILSQGGLVFAGLAAGNAAGASGALLLAQAAAVAAAMLACVYTGLEARFGAAMLERPGFLGLAEGAPRLAVFFAAGALALAGLPLTMGFTAAELLLSGLLEAGFMALAMPAIAALNGYVAVRLYARLFWGAPLDEARGAPDALPRERWALSAALLFLLAGGLLA